MNLKPTSSTENILTSSFDKAKTGSAPQKGVTAGRTPAASDVLPPWAPKMEKLT